MRWLRCVGRALREVDRFQRRHVLIGFPYAVWRKYSDDGGATLAALLTYYGFLSIFPLLLLAVALLTEVLAAQPALRHELIEELVPEWLRSDVEQALQELPPSGGPLLIGVVGLLWSGLGGIMATVTALNRIWAVPHRKRSGPIGWYGRVLLMLCLLVAGAVVAAGLAAFSSEVLHPTWVQRLGSATGSFLVILVMYLMAHKVLTFRPLRIGQLWLGAVIGAAATTVLLDLTATALPALVGRLGPVYGSFATVVGIFTLMYLVSQVLVFSAEVSAVRAYRLAPRGLGHGAPTAGDIRALTMRARIQERLPDERVSVSFGPTEEPPAVTRQE
jgi:YihY family inner membrane protein